MKRRWIRGGVALAILGSAGTAAADASWSGLWRTDDQRGQQLLQAGDAAAAAKTFADPRHRAYAELKAGDYGAAAKDLSGLPDSEAQYNRGNALAGAGDLAEALKAYDAALAQDPVNQDAQHNRDLVEKALQAQKPKEQKDSQPDQQKNPEKDQQKDAQKDGGKGSGQDGQKDSGKDPGQGSPKAGSDADSRKPDPQSSANAAPSDPGKGAKDSSSKPESSPDSASPSRPGDTKAPPEPQNAGPPAASGDQTPEHARKDDAGEKGAPPSAAAEPGDAKNPPKADDAAEARRDVEDNRTSGAKSANPGAADGPGMDGKAVPLVRDEKPQTEQQLSQQQWLRSIPDDPGGLLRRKFMMEHLMRERQGGAAEPDPSPTP